MPRQTRTARAARISLPPIELIERERVLRSFSLFVQRAFRVLEPATTYLHNWHIDLIAEYLMQVPDKTKRLIINIPPRYMKSLLVTVMWPCWLWLRAPWMRFMFCSYALSLSHKHSVDRATLLMSEWYKGIVQGHWRLRDDQNTKEERVNTAGGSMVATSVGGSATGRGGDIIIIDDPMDPKRALSDAERESTNRWIDQTLMTRLNSPEHGAIVCIMQRLHTDDVTGHLLARGAWQHLSLPCPAPENMLITFPVSKAEILYKAGSPLWPERESSEQVERQRQALGSWAFAGQYQQSPAPLEGGIVKRDWVRMYARGSLDIATVPVIVQSWDMSFKEGGESYVCGQVWGSRAGEIYLLDQVRKRLGFVDSVAAVKDMLARWPQTSAVLIEDKANGPAIIDALRTSVPMIVPVSPSGSKVERLAAVSAIIEAGHVFVPADAPWTEQLLTELTLFPSSENDDQVDALTQALAYLKNTLLTQTYDFSNTTFMKCATANLEW